MGPKPSISIHGNQKIRKIAEVVEKLISSERHLIFAKRLQQADKELTIVRTL
jgi:hypothetical protein